MNQSIAELLEKAATLPVGSEARRKIEGRILEETEITNMAQLATLVEALALAAAREVGENGDEETAETVFAAASSVAETLRKLHEMIQSVA